MSVFDAMYFYMSRINLVWWYFVILGCAVNFLSVFVNGGFAPSYLKMVFLYGKSSLRIVRPKLLDVPKHWFSHFYILATCIVVSVWLLIIRLAFFTLPVPSALVSLIACTTASDGYPRTSLEIFILSLSLFTLQICRRLYEHMYVHVPSNTTMNVCHYIAGLLHYPLAVLVILSDAPGFVSHQQHFPAVRWSSVTWTALACTAVFLVSWRQQHHVFRSLAALRTRAPGRSRRGDAKHTERAHFLPSGGLFEYVTCPHYSIEVVMYASLAALLGGRQRTWLALFYWVLSNQLGSAVMCHQWYRANFAALKTRYAIVPLVL